MINPNPDEKQFLALSAKQLSGKATADESRRLEKCLQENDSYRTTFDHMKNLLHTERSDQFLQSAIRVLCGTATTTEMSEIRALENGDTAQWKEFKFMQAVVTGIARAAEVEDDLEQPEPMPERVRQTLVTKLKDVKQGTKT